MANCCSSAACESIVTIGYMREMSKKRLTYGYQTPCVDVSAATPFNSCCSADESAYTPTYSEIISGRFANVRSFDNENPANDVNGFSASTVSLDNSCCDVSTSIKNLKESELYFGYTEISGVTLNVIKPPTECDPSYTIEQTDVFNRHEFRCLNDSIEEVSSSAPSVIKTFDGGLNKIYGEIINGSSTITVLGDIISRTTLDSCGYSKTNEVEFPTLSYTASVSLDCSTQIECEGGYVYATITDPCKDIGKSEVSITNISLSSGEIVTSSVTGNTVSIYIPRNDSGFSTVTLTLYISIGGKNGVVSCNVNRNLCKLTPETTSSIDCGAFPGDDNWEKWSHLITVHNNCN